MELFPQPSLKKCPRVLVSNAVKRSRFLKEEMKMYDRIYPGKKWLDTAGRPIQAHGFSVFWNEEKGLWYWYGENKEKTLGGKRTPSGTGAYDCIHHPICTTGKIKD
jgi:hypothetical protein